MSALKPKPRIEDIGLKQHLDGTATDHNSLDYRHFVNMVGDNLDKPKVDKSNLARAFGVNRATMSRWLEIYKKEQETANHVSE